MACTWEWAVKFCEEHECRECPTYLEEDKRTLHEKQDLHFPCCFNLVSEEERESFREQYGDPSKEV